MTPEEFAEEHGLTVDEARLILQRRAMAPKLGASRLQKAMETLAAAQKKVGVHPVVEAFDEVVKTHDPDAERGLETFYASKGGSGQLRKPVVAAEDESQDPSDY